MKKFLTPGIISVLVALSACKKSDPEGIKEYVPANIKVMAPYTEGQTVTFRNGTGQTINAVAAITTTFYNTGVCGSCASGSNPELITCTLYAGTNQFVVFRLSPSTYINLDVYSPLDNYLSAKGFNFSVLPGLSQHSCAAGGQTCLPSVILNGKTFTDVLEISGATIGNNLRKAYHTVNQGLVGFEYANGTIYNLE